ncbi:MAG TPA: hypothetical protein V6D17_07725, partial [Candidatus Obscuribacterales bacterium]
MVESQSDALRKPGSEPQKGPEAEKGADNGEVRARLIESSLAKSGEASAPAQEVPKSSRFANFRPNSGSVTTTEVPASDAKAAPGRFAFLSEKKNTGTSTNAVATAFANPWGIKAADMELAKSPVMQSLKWEKQAAEAHANKPKPDSSVLGVTKDFFQSLGHAAIQAPVTGLAQIGDALTGSKFELSKNSQISLLKGPQAAEFGTANYWAQQAGSSIGMLLPFAIAGKGVRSVTRRGLKEMEMAKVLSQRQVLGLTMKEAALTGFVNDALLRPTEEQDTRPFVMSRLLNGASGAVTMFTLSAASIPFMRKPGEAVVSRFTPLVKNNITAGFVSGIPAGFVGAHTHEYFGHLNFNSAKDLLKSATVDAKFADWKTTNESIITSTVIGVGFGSWHQVKGRHESGRRNFRWENEAKIENAQEGNRREYKIVGGEKALNEALGRLNMQGEAMVKVREQLGRKQGFLRFLGAREYGSEQTLLIQRNRGDGVNLTKATVADIIAMCNLDSTFRHKAVLTGNPKSADNPIFLRAGKDRISLATSEQQVRKGERRPIHLFDETTPEGRKIIQDAWASKLKGLDQLLVANQEALIAKGVTAEQISEYRNLIAENGSRKESIIKTDVESVELIDMVIRDEIAKGESSASSLATLRQLAGESWNRQIDGLQATVEAAKSQLLEAGMTPEQFQKFQAALKGSKKPENEVSPADTEALSHARQFVEEALMSGKDLESAMSLLSSDALGLPMEPFKKAAPAEAQGPEIVDKPPEIEITTTADTESAGGSTLVLDVDLSNKSGTITPIPRSGEVTTTLPDKGQGGKKVLTIQPSKDGETPVVAVAREKTGTTERVENEGRAGNQERTGKVEEGELTGAAKQGGRERITDETAREQAVEYKQKEVADTPPPFDATALDRAVHRIRKVGNSIFGDTAFAQSTRDAIFAAVQHESVRNQLKFTPAEWTRIIHSIAEPHQAEIMMRLLKEGSLGQLEQQDYGRLRRGIVNEWESAAKTPESKTRFINQIDKADLRIWLADKRNADTAHAFKQRVNRLIDMVSSKDGNLSHDQAKDMLLAQGRLYEAVKPYAPISKNGRDAFFERIRAN